MEVKDIIEVVLLVVFGGISLYFKYNNRLNNKVNSLIDEAEAEYKDVTQAGGKKYNYVVNGLYGLIPAPVRMFISKKLVEEIVDRTFDAMESYAVKQADKYIDAGLDKIEKDVK